LIGVASVTSSALKAISKPAAWSSMNDAKSCSIVFCPVIEILCHPCHLPDHRIQFSHIPSDRGDISRIQKVAFPVVDVLILTDNKNDPECLEHISNGNQIFKLLSIAGVEYDQIAASQVHTLRCIKMGTTWKYGHFLQGFQFFQQVKATLTAFQIMTAVITGCIPGRIEECFHR
jgi:hypothetical protein